MANGKVKKYFKKLKEMMEGEGNIQKTRPADKTRTKPFIQGGIGVIKQGKKPKEEDYLTGIKEHGPLETKHAGKVNLDNVKKVQTNVVEYHDKPSRAYGEPSTKEMKEAKKQGKRIDKFGHKLDTAHELPRIRGKKDDKNKTKTLAPIGGVAGVEMGTEAAQEAGIATTEGKSKIKTPGQKAKKKKKKKKLTEAVNVLSGNQVSQGVIEGTGEYIGTKYSNRLFGGKTEKKSKKNNKKRGR